MMLLVSCLIFTSPFNPDFSIDEKNYRRHLSWLANTSGVTGIVCNGHAAEVSSLNREERRKALAIAECRILFSVIA